MSDERRSLLEQLPGWSWHALEDNWNDGYEHLSRFAARKGHARVPKSEVEEGFKLGVWVSLQRIGREALSPERTALLEKLPRWSWDPVEDNWIEAYEQMRRFVAERGHARVPKKQNQGGFALGQWAQVQRRGRASMSDQRTALLERLPGWSWNFLEDNWNDAYQHLSDFVAERGDDGVPAKLRYHGFALGPWVANQRAGYETLSQERGALLEKLPGWSWGPRDENWNDAYQHLVDFVAEHRHARVPAKQKEEDGFALGQWVQAQRSEGRALSPERKALLEKLPGWSWRPREENWNDAYQHLVDFVAEHRHAHVPKSEIQDGFALGQWVSNQRNGRERLSSDREALLAKLPLWSWRRFDDDWNEAYRHLLDFVAERGHARVAREKYHEFPLGGWVANQRTRRPTMADERRSLLEKLPRWSWRPFDDDWNEAYRHLLKFVAERRDARVLQHEQYGGFALGQWVSRQRSSRATMDDERRSLLEALPGWSWNIRGNSR